LQNLPSGGIDPTVSQPKLIAFHIVDIDEDIAAGNVGFSKLSKAVTDQALSNPLTTPPWSNGQVIEKSSAPIVTTEHRTDQIRAGDGYRTKTRIPFQELTIACSVSDSFSPIPSIEHHKATADS
jgi:hypothetical protein